MIFGLIENMRGYFFARCGEKPVLASATLKEVLNDYKTSQKKMV
jgi:hypothetical protein